MNGVFSQIMERATKDQMDDITTSKEQTDLLLDDMFRDLNGVAARNNSKEIKDAKAQTSEILQQLFTEVDVLDETVKSNQINATQFSEESLLR